MSEQACLRARAMILKNRGITIRENASTPDIGEGSAYSKVYDILGFHKICANSEGIDRRA
jgi:hypothetical protein